MAVMVLLTMYLGWRCPRVMCLSSRHSWYCAPCSSQGGLYNQGTATLSDCQLTSNLASSNGGGLYNYGTAALTDCQFILNLAPEASIVYANGVSTTAFFSCSFVGDYGDDECAVVTDSYVDGAQSRVSDLEFYYTQAFPNGTVCSAGTNMIIAYNNDVPMPFASADSADLLSCQYESIGVYCAFDCAAGLGGVGIECR